MFLPRPAFFFFTLLGFLAAFASSGQAADKFTLDYNDVLSDVKFAPDGKSLYTSTGDGKVLWWNRQQANTQREFKGHLGLVHAVAVSADGKLVAAAGQDKTIHIWNAGDGQRVRLINGLAEPPFSLDFTPDSKHLIAGVGDSGMIWDLTQEAAPKQLAANGQVSICRVSPDGKFVALVTGNDAQLWTLGETPEQSQKLTHPKSIARIAWSADGKRLAIAGGSKVLVYATDSYKLLKTIQRDRPIHGIAFASDGRLAVATREIEILNPDLERVLQVHRGFKGTILALGFSPDGTELASTSSEEFLGTFVSELKLWNTSAGDQRSTLVGHTGRVFDIAFTPDGKQVATASDDKLVILWDVASGKEARRIENEHAMLTVDVSPNGKQIAFGGHDRQVNLWDLATGKLVRAMAGHKSYLTCLAFSPDGKRVASGDRDFSLRIWNVADGAEQSNIEAREVSSLAWSPDGAEVAFGSRGVADLGMLVIQKVGQDAKARQTIPMRQFPRDVQWSPDGKLLAAGSRDYTICLWDLAESKTPELLRGHGDEVFAIAWSPDGKRLASGSGDNMIRIWDISTRKTVQTLRGHIGRINALAWSPDGKTLASAGLDRTARLWDVGIE